jgi:hypothetical protein
MMMHDPEATYRLIRDNARRLSVEHARLREATAVSSRHSRTGILARFLERLADRIDPTGEARRTLE